MNGKYLNLSSVTIAAIHADGTSTRIYDAQCFALHSDRAEIAVYLCSEGDLADRFHGLKQLRFSIFEGIQPGDAVIDDVLTLAYDAPLLLDEQWIESAANGLLTRRYTFRAPQRVMRHPRPESLDELSAYLPAEIARLMAVAS